MLRLPPFEFCVPTSAAEAVALKAELGESASYVAGGTDLFPNMKRRQQEPTRLIPVGALPELRGIRRLPSGELFVGASETLAQVAASPLVKEHAPALARAAGLVASPLLRNMGTVGGNLCLDTRCNYYDQSYEWRQALGFCMKKEGEICWVAPSSPRCWATSSSDTAPVAVALGAELDLLGPDGETRIPAAGFYADDGMRPFTKHPDALLLGLRVPSQAGAQATYLKVAPRGSIDFPVLGVAAYVKRIAQDAPVTEARIVLGAITSYPLLIPAAAAALVGKPLSPETIAQAAQAAALAARPLENLDEPASWRKNVTQVHVRRALEALGA
ncbi:MAG: FAD binding domain-containing protein [Deltaproteobacteria bacterium]|nr:FAD binding domain-containing protein [Deltaproteobacteria bacterium]